MPASSFQILEDLAINYLNTRKRLYVVDGFAGWDTEDRVKVRVICTRAYHALFMTNMLVKPTLQELERDFNDGADYYIFNAG
jgi:phosphoenolpyruvate carboxykinase (ATP)